jgi:hypothetical protein
MRWLALYQAIARTNSGEPDAGRFLLAWAHAAGFTDVTPGASTWCYATPEDRAWWGGLWADRITQSAIARQAVAEGFASTGELEDIAAGWRRWAEPARRLFAVLHGDLLRKYPRAHDRDLRVPRSPQDDCNRNVSSAPRCGADRGYLLQQARRWFTLFFIPIFPVSKPIGDQVQCTTCHTNFRPEVLDAPTSEEFSENLRGAMRVASIAMLKASDPHHAAARHAAIAAAARDGTRALRRRVARERSRSNRYLDARQLRAIAGDRSERPGQGNLRREGCTRWLWPTDHSPRPRPSSSTRSARRWA